MRLLLVPLLLLLPLPLHAAEEPVTRAGGFALLWEPLKRPVEETPEAPFPDTNDTLLTYAKARGILDGGDFFRPDVPLRLNDALLWLLRSRNVEDPRRITGRSLALFIARYPLGIARRDLTQNAPLTRSDLAEMMTALDETLGDELHTASYYGTEFEGRTTAFGERFNPYAMTAAHRTLPHNTLLKVTNGGNGRFVIVRINDRGPYAEGRDIDLSRTAFRRLAPLSRGILTAVTLERLGDYTTLRNHVRHPRSPAGSRRSHH